MEPGPGGAERVAARFDDLLRRRADLEAVARAAAELTGLPARLVDRTRRVVIRVEPDGERRDSPVRPEPDWLAVRVLDGAATLWLESAARGRDLDALVLERAGAAAALLIRHRPVTGPAHTPAAPLLETAIAAGTPLEARLAALRGLGLNPEGRLRVLAQPHGKVLVQPEGDPVPVRGRAGVGPAVPAHRLPAHRLPESAARALTALRLTAEGTTADPGPRVVRAEDLGGLEMLAAAVAPGTTTPDAAVLTAAAEEAPWLLPTLVAVANAPNQRAAAQELFVHHSTLRVRLQRAEVLLGWSLRDAAGMLRLRLALAVRLLGRPV
ncbi:helix-turn-helix domain-containing protein [Actinosynnema mirum]|uniref:Putative transcriptional regulator, PucR family n=1 Tax=Actinosynnema mirum (strain ATCC 29888 / DSM 43827 / JCM 3225 / NBRC 14064 / NCIMB 13271 / NRRL B-12336 / IMRU 3971 / 101) TaxID=446462 RepID=C6W9T7_ACTMD|nr:helix-turn-helix domain-containing protein [Actinosynnema mirum]ACU37304.1 putative transcriptional regulator, PucR family [Actinosynnema mirum DSM 43827]